MLSDTLIVLLWCHGVGTNRERALASFLRACPRPYTKHILPGMASEYGYGTDRAFCAADEIGEWALSLSATLDFFRNPELSGPSRRDRLDFGFVRRKAGWLHIQRLRSLGHIPDRDWRKSKAEGRAVLKPAKHHYETLEEEWHCRTRLAKKRTFRH